MPVDTRTRAFQFTTQRPVAILMTFLAVAVFGAVSYTLLPLSLMPDLAYPSLTVRTEYAGSAPEEVETAVSRPIEQELGVVGNLVRISSVSRAGVSDVTLDFAWGTSMSDATQDVREMLDQVFLPDDATRPLILRYDPQLDPVIRLGLHGQRDLYFLREYAEEELRRDLESLPGIAAVKVKGGLEEEIRVELDERRLATFGLDITDVGARLAAANVNLAGGNLEEGQTEYIVRTLNEFRNVEEIAEIAVANRQGAIVRIRDVGRVYRDHIERDVITRVNGEESVEINIFKEADANIVEVAQTIRARVFGTLEQQAFSARGERPADDTEDTGADGRNRDRLRRQMTNYVAAQLPPGVSVTLLSDQSTFIQNAIDEVRSTAVWGGLLAIVVLYFFLRRVVPTLIIAVAIPVSIVATFAPMYQVGVSLNIMSLGGLALGIGMLVDNSVVVLESITRCREEGDAMVRSVIRGTGEVGMAVVASTLTTVAVFIPIVFVEGVAGQVFGDLSLTVVFSLVTSLIVALFLVPMLASRPFLAAADELARPGDGESPWLARLRELLTGPVARVPVIALLALLGAVAAAAKAIALILACLTSPLWALFTGYPTIARWGKAGTVFGHDGVDRLWPGLLAFHAPDELADSVVAERRLWTEASPGRRALRVPLTLFGVVWAYLLRTPLQLLLSGLGKIAVGIGLTGLVALGALLGAAIGLLITVSSPLLRAFDAAFGMVRRGYPLILRAALARPTSTAAALMAMTTAILWYAVPQLGMELIPEVRQGIFDVQARLPVGTPLERTDTTIAPLERLVRATPGVAAVATTVGVDRDEFDPDPEAGEHSGRLTVRLTRTTSPLLYEDGVMASIREQLEGRPNLVIKFSRPAMFTTKTPIEVEVRADDLDTLRRVSDALAQRLAPLPELTDVKSTLQRGHPEIQIQYDRERLSHYGLDIAQVAGLVRNKVQGDVASRFRRGDRRVDIRVRVRPEDRATIGDLEQLVVNPGQANPIRLESVATLQLAEGPSEIRRIDQRRSAVIGANTTTDLSSATTAIEAVLGDFQIRGEYDFAITGQREEMERSTRSLMFALSLAIFLVYVVMASQFESLVHPFVILFSIPLAAVGVVLTLWVLSVPLSVVVLLGSIMLAGIVVNNAIVLVDYINHLRRDGAEKIEAIVRAGEVRLRPILMTTFTTVIGLLPMAVGLGDGAEIRAPMAITVIAGLLTSTVLTLIVVPVLYAVMDRRP